MLDSLVILNGKPQGVKAAAAFERGPARFDYIYRWKRHDRQGQRCAVTARGVMNSCRVEFEDGFVMITSRNAIRKAP